MASQTDNLPPISDDNWGFSYSASTGLTLAGIPCATPEHLRTLAPSREWYVAQFTFYAVPYDETATVEELAKALREAVQAGKFAALPASTTETRQALAARYSSENTQHLAALSSSSRTPSPAVTTPPTAALPTAFDDAMLEHRDFLSSLDAARGSPAGEYVLRCPAVAASDPDTADVVLALHIRRDAERGGGALAGDFELGVLEGIMRFWGDGDEPALPDDAAAGGGGKRKRAGTMVGKPLKRGGGAAARKLQFLWRGRETSRGEVQGEGEGGNRGVLEWGDDTFTVFKGSISAEVLGGTVGFEGFKTGDAGLGGVLNRWADFEEEEE
ncbi:hypothetical protein EDC01DRAFT_668992 [Geopyxis carbonaria]|nr:hypothetical protein EDC01DRAFT_668992 [Geopyxis carbonaria]